MAFKSANEKLVGRHAPIRLFAFKDGLQVGKNLAKKLLNPLFHLRAGNVVGIVKIEAKVIIPDPSLHDRLPPLLGIEKNELVDIPGEKEFRSEL
ncbi:MAG: hypothetical protein ABSH38_14525 [Verrucomicrobiota bacterium]